MNQVQILITTTDNSFRNELSESEFSDLKLDFFDRNQANEYFEKSLKDNIENKDSIIYRILESEKNYASDGLRLAFSPHRLQNFIIQI